MPGACLSRSGHRRVHRQHRNTAPGVAAGNSATSPQITDSDGRRSQPPRNVDSGWARRSAIGDAFIVLARLVWMRLRDTGPAARDR
jgi:hypothetical protein